VHCWSAHPSHPSHECARADGWLARGERGWVV